MIGLFDSAIGLNIDVLFDCEPAGCVFPCHPLTYHAFREIQAKLKDGVADMYVYALTVRAYCKSLESVIVNGQARIRRLVISHFTDVQQYENERDNDFYLRIVMDLISRGAKSLDDIAAACMERAKQPPGPLYIPKKRVVENRSLKTRRPHELHRESGIVLGGVVGTRRNQPIAQTAQEIAEAEAAAARKAAEAARKAEAIRTKKEDEAARKAEATRKQIEADEAAKADETRKQIEANDKILNAGIAKGKAEANALHEEEKKQLLILKLKRQLDLAKKKNSKTFLEGLKEGKSQQKADDNEQRIWNLQHDLESSNEKRNLLEAQTRNDNVESFIQGAKTMRGWLPSNLKEWLRSDSGKDAGSTAQWANTGHEEGETYMLENSFVDPYSMGEFGAGSTNRTNNSSLNSTNQFGESYSDIPYYESEEGEFDSPGTARPESNKITSIIEKSNLGGPTHTNLFEKFDAILGVTQIMSFGWAYSDPPKWAFVAVIFFMRMIVATILFLQQRSTQPLLHMILHKCPKALEQVLERKHWSLPNVASTVYLMLWFFSACTFETLEQPKTEFALLNLPPVMFMNSNRDMVRNLERIAFAVVQSLTKEGRMFGFIFACIAVIFSLVFLRKSARVVIPMVGASYVWYVTSASNIANLIQYAPTDEDDTLGICGPILLAAIYQWAFLRTDNFSGAITMGSLIISTSYAVYWISDFISQQPLEKLELDSIIGNTTDVRYTFENPMDQRLIAKSTGIVLNSVLQIQNLICGDGFKEICTIFTMLRHVLTSISMTGVDFDFGQHLSTIPGELTTITGNGLMRDVRTKIDPIREKTYSIPASKGKSIEQSNSNLIDTMETLLEGENFLSPVKPLYTYYDLTGGNIDNITKSKIKDYFQNNNYEYPRLDDFLAQHKTSKHTSEKAGNRLNDYVEVLIADFLDRLLIIKEDKPLQFGAIYVWFDAFLRASTPLIKAQIQIDNRAVITSEYIKKFDLLNIVSGLSDESYQLYGKMKFGDITQVRNEVQLMDNTTVQHKPLQNAFAAKWERFYRKAYEIADTTQILLNTSIAAGRATFASLAFFCNLFGSILQWMYNTNKVQVAFVGGTVMFITIRSARAICSLVRKILLACTPDYIVWFLDHLCVKIKYNKSSRRPKILTAKRNEVNKP